MAELADQFSVVHYASCLFPASGMPSVVCFTHKGVLVGQEALDDAACKPQYLIYETKRLMGLSAEHDAVRSQKSKARYQFSEIKGDTDGCPVQGVKVVGLCHCHISLHSYCAQAMPIQRVCIVFFARTIT